MWHPRKPVVLYDWTLLRWAAHGEEQIAHAGERGADATGGLRNGMSGAAKKPRFARGFFHGEAVIRRS
jgi:hypothetical protein